MTAHPTRKTANGVVIPPKPTSPPPPPPAPKQPEPAPTSTARSRRARAHIAATTTGREETHLLQGRAYPLDAGGG